MQSNNKPLIVLVGATAVGKTALSLRLASHINAEIISADSRLVYRGMDIGTAKPSPQELSLIPHHLIDIIEPDEPWSLADFQKTAYYAIQSIHKKHKIPLLVGGTGQYIKAILEQWDLPKQPPNPTLRNYLLQWSNQIPAWQFHHYLKLLDPIAAQTIDPSNKRRVIRALEVIFQSGRKFSEQRKKSLPQYQFLIIGLHRPRPELYQRIDFRINEMIAHGFVEEVQGLLAKGYSPDLPSMSAIGYREMVLFIKGRTTLDETVRLMQRATRNFVRRQANWFKLEDPAIKWFTLNTQAEAAIENQILNTINQFLNETISS